ncbi:MAG: SEL1-like repeat protein [Phycisphaeraceae bacterium]|nr:SEL1-like repeat protein [Phycisphaeraceae bacterium]
MNQGQGWRGLATVLAMLAIVGLTCHAYGGQEATGQEQGEPSEAPTLTQPTARDVALAVAAAEQLIAQARLETDAQASAETMRRARERLVRVMVDPRLEDVRAWQTLGTIAAALKDGDDAALAFEAIGRLRPDWHEDTELLQLMASLDLLGASERIDAIKGNRETFLILYSSSQRIAGQRPSDDRTKAVFVVGQSYASGFGVPRNESEAVRWYRFASEEGSVDAMFNLGVMLDSGRGGSKDEAGAVRWYRSAAEQGNAHAMVNLGMMLANGRGAATDKVEAVRWYRSAAEQGIAGAMFNLALMLESGHGVSKDEVAAVRWYRSAAEEGIISAMTSLGKMLATGRGIAKDEAEGAQWFRRAAEGGDVEGMFLLGAFLFSGIGVDKDEREAVVWLRRASTQGHTGAMYLLGGAMIFGMGVEQNEAEGVEWLRRAARAGNEDAQNTLRQRGETW